VYVSSPDGDYRMPMLTPHDDYLIVAIPYQELEYGRWREPGFLRSVRDRATRVTITSTEKKVLDLRIATP